ncbi:putative MYND domain protein [Mycena sanguinolenta]|uniref:Putative MYND domain protein n=1 Tax=Mycena sanguinolenta TaxID=230812 RepID=A0A8H6ZDT4_9AGAR|nr:putative MYND domain protein [Mycena sanguinolenta]
MSWPTSDPTPFDDQALMNRLATLMPPPKGKDRPTTCWMCFKNNEELGRPMRRCSKCQTANYCSKECQTLSWPTHKAVCDGAEYKIFSKLVKNLSLNFTLLMQLNCCFVLAFDLLQHSRRDEMLFACVDFAVEPCSLTIQGMLQLNAFTPITELDPSADSARRALWCMERAEADSEGCHAEPVVIIDFIHPEAKSAITLRSRIPAILRDTVKEWLERGFAITSGINGEATSVPYTIENALQCISALIRSDTTNAFRLRAEMQPSDILVIRDAARDSDWVPAMLLHAKIARELVYRSIYERRLVARRDVGDICAFLRFRHPPPRPPQVHLSFSRHLGLGVRHRPHEQASVSDVADLRIAYEVDGTGYRLQRVRSTCAHAIDNSTACAISPIYALSSTCRALATPTTNLSRHFRVHIFSPHLVLGVRRRPHEQGFVLSPPTQDARTHDLDGYRYGYVSASRSAIDTLRQRASPLAGARLQASRSSPTAQIASSPSSTCCGLVASASAATATAISPPRHRHPPSSAPAPLPPSLKRVRLHCASIGQLLNCAISTHRLYSSARNPPVHLARALVPIRNIDRAAVDVGAARAVFAQSNDA